MNKATEKILLFQIQQKQNSEAYGKLYDAYVRQIYRFVYFKVSTHEEAEDITAEVFLKAWRYLQEKKEVKSFSGLLYRIARNGIVDLYRARTNHPESLGIILEKEEEKLSDNKKWLTTIHDKLEAQEILEALKRLKQEYQEVLTLRFVDELKIEEISEIVGKSGLVVRVTIHRALKKLKELLAVHKKNNQKKSSN
jgi:RNA polymerase sigma-70 factor (ECF subfamily)